MPVVCSLREGCDEVAGLAKSKKKKRSEKFWRKFCLGAAIDKLIADQHRPALSSDRGCEFFSIGIIAID